MTRLVPQLEGRGVTTHRSKAKEERAKEVLAFTEDIDDGKFVAIDCGRDTDGFGFWLGKARGKAYLAKHDWTDFTSTKIHKGDLVINIEYYKMMPHDLLVFEHEKQRAIHADWVLHADCAPSPHVVGGAPAVKMETKVVEEVETEYDRVHAKELVTNRPMPTHLRS